MLSVTWQEDKAGTAKETELVALNPKKKIPFALSEKIELSRNTRLFRFALQSPRHKLGLPIGQHMFFYCKVRARTALTVHLPLLQHLCLPCMPLPESSIQWLIRAATPKTGVTGQVTSL